MEIQKQEWRKYEEVERLSRDKRAGTSADRKDVEKSER